MKKWALSLLFVVLAVGRADAMLIAIPRGAPPQWVISVNARIGGAQVQYTTNAWVYTPGPNYLATLYAIGPYYKSPQAQHVVGRFDEISTRDPRGAVFNGGPWQDDPYVPAGLLVVDGVTFHPLDLSKNAQKDFKESAVLCFSAAGHMQILETSSPTSQKLSLPLADPTITSECNSAVQAGPIVLQKGQNVIRTPGIMAVRTILGFDANGSPYLVIFQQPVQLLIAAEFLRASPGSQALITVTAGTPNPKGMGNATIGNVPNSDQLTATRGLGLVTAINLDGDASSACFYQGRPIIGFSAMQMPSAISLQPR